MNKSSCYRLAAKGPKLASEKRNYFSVEQMVEMESYPKQLPPTSEIAQLAVLLAHGIPMAKRNPDILAGQAIGMWLTCNKLRNEWNEFLMDKSGQWRPLLKTPQFKEIVKLPEPKSFPVGLDECLKLALPAKRPEDRMKVFREFLRHNGLSEDKIIQNIGYFRAHGFDEEWYKQMHLVRVYARILGRENRSKRAQAGGLARKKRLVSGKKSSK
jgi:hypothetical protein